MDSIQIVEVVSHLNPLNTRFLGVYPCDKLTTIEIDRKPCCLIINTAPSTHNGEHWVGIYLSDFGECEFFDSYGMLPSGDILKWINSISSKFIYNDCCIQGLFTAACGAHCLYYLYHRCNNFTMGEIVRDASDAIVQAFVCGLYSPDNDDFDYLSDTSYLQRSVMRELLVKEVTR